MLSTHPLSGRSSPTTPSTDSAATRPTVAAGPVDPVINEFSASTTGTDVEYVEVFGDADTDYSAFTVLEIEGDSTRAGIDRRVISVGTTDTGGFYWPVCGDLASRTDRSRCCSSKDFTGSVGDDLDTDDDGTFDYAPWTRSSMPSPSTTAAQVISPTACRGARSQLRRGEQLRPRRRISHPRWVRHGRGHGLGAQRLRPGRNPRIPLGPSVLVRPTTRREQPTRSTFRHRKRVVTPFTPIYDVQGNGAASPLVGTEVAIEGVVVGDFQNNGSPDNGDLNGFHVQDPTGDGDAATSDGVFVFAPGGIDVSVGDAVRVRGTVSEFNGLTEITASQIWSCSTGISLPAATVLSLPVTSVDDFEPYEGMSVTFPQALVISEYFNFDRFGEIVLTSERNLTPTAEFEPGRRRVASGAGLSARPDHARRRSDQPEPGPGHSSERRRVQSEQSVPGRRHGAERDRRHGLRVRPVPDPAHAGRRLHQRQSEDGRAR